MPHCPNCFEDVPEGAKYCPHCAVAQPRRPPRPLQQRAQPLALWAPPLMALQAAGVRAIPRSQPSAGPSISATTSLIAIGIILLSLILVIIVGQEGRPLVAVKPTSIEVTALPSVGMMGETIHVGDTIWGVAFIEKPENIDNSPSRVGEYFAVGIVVGNKGQSDLELSASSIVLMDEKSGERYSPLKTVWGIPGEIRAGIYSTHFILPPQMAVAGLIIFDIPKDLTQPRLLVRDLADASPDFTGKVDLTQQMP